MTNEQILKKAIEKAIDDGFDITNLIADENSQWGSLSENIKDLTIRLYIETHLYKAIIFSHSFAKAFFGIEWPDIRTKEEVKADAKAAKNNEIRLERAGQLYIENSIKYWQHHLQQLVLQPNPISYLKKFL